MTHSKLKRARFYLASLTDKRVWIDQDFATVRAAWEYQKAHLLPKDLVALSGREALKYEGHPWIIPDPLTDRPRYDLACAASHDAATRQMRAAGRTTWNADDYDLACKTFNALYPDPYAEPPKEMTP